MAVLTLRLPALSASSAGFRGPFVRDQDNAGTAIIDVDVAKPALDRQDKIRFLHRRRR